VFFRGHAQFVVECVVPDFFHIVPVGHDAVLDGVFQGQNTSLALSLVPNVRVFLTHTDHDTLMPGASNNGREHCPRGIVSGKSGFAHAGAIVDHQSSNFFVTHDY